jgi:hypothetical protein
MKKKASFTPVDLFVFLQFRYKSTLFPELLEYFGLQKMLQFVKVFGGMRIKCPKWNEVRAIVRDVEIYNALRPNPSSKRVKTLLSKKHSLAASEVGKIFYRMHDKMLDFRKCTDAGDYLDVRVTDKRSVSDLCQ